jgi:hypothetical protein
MLNVNDTYRFALNLPVVVRVKKKVDMFRKFNGI